MQLLRRSILHLLRKFVAGITRIFFRFDIEGKENLPRGGALLVANHISLLDPFFIVATIPRLVFFVMYRKLYEYWLWHWFLKRINMIPIDGGQDKQKLEEFNQTCREMVSRGEMICIFPEGQITRVGQLLKFKKGIEHIAGGSGVPIVPIQIETGEHTPMKFKPGKNEVVKFSLGLKRYRITINIGKPAAHDTSAFRLRQAVMELNAGTFKRRFRDHHTLNYFFQKATDANYDRVFYFENGKSVSFGEFQHKVMQLVQKLVRFNEEKINLNLPQGPDWLLLNVAGALAGKIIVSIPAYNALPSDGSILFFGQGGISTTEFISEATVIEEDYLSGEVHHKSREYADIRRTVLEVHNHTNESMARLSHLNILATCKSLMSVYTLEDPARVLGILPPSSPYGYILNVWLPIFLGCRLFFREQAAGKSLKDTIVQNDINTLIAPAEIVEELLNEDIVIAAQLTHIITGQKPVSADLKKELRERYELTTRESLGLENIGLILAVNTPDYKGRDVTGNKLIQEGTRWGTVGRPLPGLAIHVVDSADYDRILEQGETGMLLVKGAAVPEFSNHREKLFRGQWFITGLRGRIDSDGFLELVHSSPNLPGEGPELLP